MYSSSEGSTSFRAWRDEQFHNCSRNALFISCRVVSSAISIERKTRTCWSIKVWRRSDAGDSGSVEPDSHFGAIVTLGCPASANQQSPPPPQNVKNNYFHFRLCLRIRQRPAVLGCSLYFTTCFAWKKVATATMHFTGLSAWTIPKQVFDYSQGSVRAGQHVLQQQLVGEHLRRQTTKKQKTKKKQATPFYLK